MKTTEEDNINNEEIYKIETISIESEDFIRNEDYLLEIKKELIKNKKNYYEINSDFIKMEELFNNKFNYLIDESKKFQENSKTNPKSFYDYFIKIFFFNNSFEKCRRKEVKNIFLRDLLYFYDEYSYRINYKIKEINFDNLEKKLSNFNELSSLLITDKKPIELNDNITSYKYLDLYYFIEKLEIKVSENFDISIEEIRNIIYGEDITENYIEYFYKEMLEMRKKINFFDSKEKIQEKYEYSNKLITEYSIDYSTNIMGLYKYHLDTNPETFVEKVRFDLFRDFLKYFKIYFQNDNEFQITEYSEENERKLEEECCLSMFYDLVRPFCFSCISYISFINNLKIEDQKVLFFDKFNEKDRLISLIEKYNKIIE